MARRDLGNPDVAQQAGNGESPLKLRRGEDNAITVELLQKLLADTQRAILQNQREVLRDELQLLEQNNNQRFEKVHQALQAHDDKFEAMERTIQTMQAKLDGEVSSTAASSDPQRDKDRRTVIVGGWPRDTRRQDILNSMKKVIDTLQLAPDLDGSLRDWPSQELLPDSLPGQEE